MPTTGDEYRLKATDFLNRAQIENTPKMRFQLENLGRAYLRLAAQADRNGLIELVYEPPVKQTPEEPE
jgi:hypothetical protein